MKIKAESIGDCKNFMQYIDSVTSLKSQEQVLGRIGKLAVERLKEVSPVVTGEYRAGWRWTIEKDGNDINLHVHNISHKEVDDLSHMLEYGHATRNHGYVRGRHFIKRTMNSVYKDFEDIHGWRLSMENVK